MIYIAAYLQYRAPLQPYARENTTWGRQSAYPDTSDIPQQPLCFPLQRAPTTGKCPYDFRARAALQKSAAAERREAWRFRGTGERRRYYISDWTA